MRRIVIVAFVGLLAAACSLPFGIGQASTSQLINGATDNLSKATGFEIGGKFTTSGTAFKIDVKYQSSGAAHIDLTTGTTHIEAMQFNGTVYYHGSEAASNFVGS